VQVKYKGQGDLFPTISELQAAGIPVHYHLVGGGDPTRLKALASKLGIEDQIIFHGVLKHERVFALLEAMDIYVQPSHQEGLPRAVVEAMSYGLPVIGAATGGIPELLPPTRLFKAGRGREFKEVLENLLPAEAQVRDARRNFSRAQDYREGALAQKRRRFYLEFLEGHGLQSGPLGTAAI
jgi:glycosyltransferase involved in cell wall biosynthesis